MTIIDDDELHRRFTYHPPRPEQVIVYEQVRDRARDLATYMSEVLPESHEASLALTYLEQAVMWANAAVARRS